MCSGNFAHVADTINSATRSIIRQGQKNVRQTSLQCCLPDSHAHPHPDLSNCRRTHRAGLAEVGQVVARLGAQADGAQLRALRRELDGLVPAGIGDPHIAVGVDAETVRHDQCPVAPRLQVNGEVDSESGSKLGSGLGF